MSDSDSAKNIVASSSNKKHKSVDLPCSATILSPSSGVMVEGSSHRPSRFPPDANSRVNAMGFYCILSLCKRGSALGRVKSR